MSFFDRVADAAAEAAYDVDVALSTQMHRREHRKFKECKVSEQRDFERAQKLQEEERDELLAYKLGEREKKEEHDRISAERDQKAADADLARQLSAKWEQIDLRAAKRDEKKKQRIALKDEKLAKKMQQSAIGDLEKDKHIQDMERCWTAPRLMVSDHDEGICIQARLPNLSGAEVTLQTDPVAIVVRAQPEKVALFKAAQDLGAKVRIPEAIRFSVDLNIVGEAAVGNTSVSHTYSDDTLKIFLRSLCIAK